jgi:hypothetical protein
MLIINSSFFLQNGTFFLNIGSNGGALAIINPNGNININNFSIFENIALENGGGIYI